MSLPNAITRIEHYLKAIAEDKGLPDVTSEDNGDVLTVVDGAWAKAQPSGGESPIAVFSVTFKDYNSNLEKYDHIYWGANDTTHEIVAGTTNYCAELDKAMADGKAIMIKTYLGDKTFNLVSTSLQYNSDLGIYSLKSNLGGKEGYYPDINGTYARFQYTKDESSNKDGTFTVSATLEI
jgi:hypothetical protein